MFLESPQHYFKEKALAPGVKLRLAWGERLMMSLVEMEPHSLVPRHSHPHEQAGIVLQGELEMVIGGERRLLQRGQGYHIPSGVEHSARTFAGAARALDVFSPPREDYIKD